MTAWLERCLTGRLRDVYPPGEDDLEVRVDDGGSMAELTATLRRVVVDVVQSHPRCRRVVFAAAQDDEATAAVAAGFRRVVEVEAGGESVMLLVAEPAWVTAVDMDLDRVPQT